MTSVAPIVMVVDDFMCRARIQEVAKLLGVKVVACDALHARATAKELGARGVLVDLNLASASAIQLIEDLRRDAALVLVAVLGFVSHVDHDVGESARRAGASQVLPRSRFHRELVEILQTLGVAEP